MLVLQIIYMDLFLWNLLEFSWVFIDLTSWFLTLKNSVFGLLMADRPVDRSKARSTDRSTNVHNVHEPIAVDWLSDNLPLLCRGRPTSWSTEPGLGVVDRQSQRSEKWLWSWNTPRRGCTGVMLIKCEIITNYDEWCKSVTQKKNWSRIPREGLWTSPHDSSRLRVEVHNCFLVEMVKIDKYEWIRCKQMK